MDNKRAGRVPVMFKLGVLGTIVLVVVVGAVVLSSRKDVSALDLGLPSNFQPGKKISREVVADWQCDFWNSMASCTDSRASDIRYYVSYSTTERIITRVSKWLADSNVTLGDLILVWGEPSSSGGAVVSWGTRSAFALGSNGRSPNDKVYFVSYTLAPIEEEVWRGFVDRQPYPPLDIPLPTLNVSPSPTP